MDSVRAIFKNDDGTNIKNLNCFSRFCEMVLNEQLLHFLNHSLPEFMCAYRNGYSTSHVFIRLIENCRKALDNNLFAWAILMDLSKAFDCIPHNLLIAKLHAVGWGFDTVTFLFTYLKERAQGMSW